jgi:O-antigen ligase
MSTKRYRIHDRIFFFTSIAIAFFLPVFWRILPTLIGVMVLNWLIDGRFIRNMLLIFREKQRGLTLGFSSLYLLYVAGLLYTKNFDYAWFDLEVKLSLFIFPLIFATSRWPLFSHRQMNGILWSFVAGCLAGALILLGHAMVNKYSYGILDAVYYMKLSWFFHPSYLSMYYNFALGFLILQLLKNLQSSCKARAGIMALILFFLGMIFLLVSKAGMLIMILIILSTAIYAWIGHNRWTGVAVISGGLMIFFMAYLMVPVTFSRMAGAEKVVTSVPQVNRVTAESNADRLAVWHTAIGIIKQHFLFGVGTGDVKDALMDGYRENNIIPALEHKFNAHSQYLQTFITLGLAGFLLLLVILIAPAIRAMGLGQELYFVFLAIFAINILFESMLEIQQGVVFYAFFNIILFSSRRIVP